ncbi:MAG: hypothetical protein ACREJO_04355 [Phycisphaerales bacterium]
MLSTKSLIASTIGLASLAIGALALNASAGQKPAASGCCTGGDACVCSCECCKDTCSAGGPCVCACGGSCCK